MNSVSPRMMDTAASYWTILMWIVVSLASQNSISADTPQESNWHWGLRNGGLCLGIATTKSTYQIGEPIPMVIRFTNSLDLGLKIWGDGTRRAWKITVIDREKQLLVPINPWIAYYELHGKAHPNDPEFPDIMVKLPGWLSSGRLQIFGKDKADNVVDLAREFDLSKPGEYLVNVSRTIRWMEATDFRSTAKTYEPGEYRSGNLLLTIVASTSGSSDETVKLARATEQLNPTSTSTTRNSGGSPSSEPGSTISRPNSAEAGPGVGAVRGPPEVAAHRGGPEGAASGTGGSPHRVMTFSRSTGLMFLFALLGFGVLWWLFRGK